MTHHNFPGTCQGNKSRTMFFALLVIFAGFLFLLHGLGVLPYEFRRVFLTWQMLLIAIGIYNLFTPQHKTSGLILIAVGGIFLYNKFFPFAFSVWNLVWPTILIVVGIAILLKHNRRPRLEHHEGDGPIDPSDPSDPTGHPPYSSRDSIDEVSIFSGSEKTITSQNFRGGKITSIFGGSEINLTPAKLSQGHNVLDMFCMFGGSTFIVPSDWEVNVDVTAIFGGFSDKRYKSKELVTDNAKRIDIKGLVIFGGGEIKSY